MGEPKAGKGQVTREKITMKLRCDETQELATFVR
jgi:hypothetical protein